MCKIPLEFALKMCKTVVIFAMHHPSVAVRFSRCNYRTDGSVINLPLYLAGKTSQLITENR